VDTNKNAEQIILQLFGYEHNIRFVLFL